MTEVQVAESDTYATEAGTDHPIDVIGVSRNLSALSPAAHHALSSAALVVGARRHLATVAELTTDSERVELACNLSNSLDAIAAHRGPVCVLASGDPGFFGIGRLLGQRFGPGRLRVHPQPSAVSEAFARLGLSWDDATVVSAHGRKLSDAVDAATTATKVGVLTSPANPPESIGQAFAQRGLHFDRVAVCSHLGEEDEAIVLTDLEALAGGHWRPLSVVILWREPASESPTLAWGQPVDQFDHRQGMITKDEVRAVILGKLALPASGVLWDIGSGSGSVAVESARLRRGLRVIAVDRDSDAAARTTANARRHGVSVEVHCANAVDAMVELAPPDRIFVGGGGPEVLNAARRHLNRGGVMVASYASLERAAIAHRVLGNLVQIVVNRACLLPNGDTRLGSANPVFVAWSATI